MFHLACVPPTANHQSKKIVRVGKFSKLADSEGLVAAKDMLDALLLPHQPKDPVPPPIELRLSFCWPWPSGASKKRVAAGSEWKTTSPDADNLCKTLADRLAALRFIRNDAEIASLHVTKEYGDTPGILVSIEQMLPQGMFDEDRTRSMYRGAR